MRLLYFFLDGHKGSKARDETANLIEKVGWTKK